MPAAHRPEKNALDEFLSESEIRLDNKPVHVDPREIQLDSISAPSSVTAVESRTMTPETLHATAAADNARIQWWAMFAAALVAIGVSLLVFGAFARFGQF